jgi:hypothetical protein
MLITRILMKLLNFISIIFVFYFFNITAENSSNYKMLDLGVFGTDRSVAMQVNEQGQVFGYCSEGRSELNFLWDEIEGMKIVNIPEGAYTTKLNNNGQITGVYSTNSSYRIFIWDSNMGFWDIESFKDTIFIMGFNDELQILIQSQDIYLLDHGKRINLTIHFREQYPGNWSSFRAVSLNNKGQVAFNVCKTENNISYQRAFLWKDGTFQMIMPEKGGNISLVGIDDFENMIVDITNSDSGFGGCYFVNPSKNIIAHCDGTHIRNGMPINLNCLPDSLKKDNEGKLYFTRGIPIKKLIKEESPYFNVANSIDVWDQNSKGYVVGSIDTIYSGSHAFLAIPITGIAEEEND